MMGAGGGRGLSLEEFSAPCCGIRFSQCLALDAGGLPRSLQLGVKELGGCSLWARSNQERISDLGRNRFKSCLAGNNVGIQRK